MIEILIKILTKWMFEYLCLTEKEANPRIRGSDQKP